MDLITTGTALAIANKLLGKTADEISKDISSLYSKGRDKIVDFATKKITNIDDGKQANLRVARDVFWGGSFTEEAICAEYFGGILASSRSDDGKDDSGVYYVDIIKSLSSTQLHLHYVLYRSLNKLLLSDNTKNTLNVGQGTELYTIKLYMSAIELSSVGLNIDIDLEALYRKGLIHEYKTDGHTFNDAQDQSKSLPYVMIVPTTLGIQLLCIANNSLQEWRQFPVKDFGDFKDIKTVSYFDSSLENIIAKIK